MALLVLLMFIAISHILG
ncbi:hypothetical protein CGLO_18157 [Colletotrichum gloeosporioides Cg-14]|uniref:Uncharacterized protein n=1 Tax=Colletotrichum gloeosporioides (strain Cg-14) TaxID=1237896 RepID=T0L4P2_COLGC|nr:hypothetical protein CGLO_18157 [Colletotrichum gloeosporioides Cg-14]